MVLRATDNGPTIENTIQQIVTIEQAMTLLDDAFKFEVEQEPGRDWMIAQYLSDARQYARIAVEKIQKGATT